MKTEDIQKQLSVAPVFVLGAPRSGTSVICRMLTSCFGYSGEREGHLFTVLKNILDCFDRQEHFVAVSGFSEEYTHYHRSAKDLRSQVIKLFVEDSKKLFPDPWYDKTPHVDMIDFVPTLAEIFPDAVFLFMKRNAIDNILSQQRRFTHSFDFSCKIWSSAMRSWLRVREDVSERSLEIDQFELQSDPINVLERLIKCLKLPELALQTAYPFLMRSCIERTNQEPLQQVALQDTGWSEKELAIFHEHCKSLMLASGYSMNPQNSKASEPAGHGQKMCVTAENLLNKWTTLPKTLFDTRLQLHANKPNEPPFTLHFRNVYRLRSETLSFSATLNNKNTFGLHFVLQLREADGEIRWQQAFDLKAGVQEIRIKLPEGELFNLSMLLQPVKGAANNFHCGLMINDVKWS